MFVVDLPFPEKCNECPFWKSQYCHILKKKISYNEGEKKDSACTLIPYKKSEK